MSKGLTPSWDELAQVTRLLGDARTHSSANGVRVRHVLRGCCNLMGSVLAVMLTVSGADSENENIVECIWCSAPSKRGLGGEGTSELPLGDDEVMEVHLGDPAIRRILRNPHSESTFRRSDVIDDFEWSRTQGARLARARHEIGDSLYSVSDPLEGGLRRVLVLHRHADAGPFLDCNVQMVRLLHDHSPWLFESSRNSALTDRVLRLSPRLREVLEAMLDGLSEKEIAARLGITFSTTHSYVKRLYMCMGMRSRAEIMAQCLPHRHEWLAGGDPAAVSAGHFQRDRLGK